MAGSHGLVFFDAETYERIGTPLTVEAGAATPAYSPAGKTIAYVSIGRGQVRLIDGQSREPLAQTGIPGRIVERLAFTNDGSLLMTLELHLKSGDRSIRFRDASTLEPVGVPIEPEGLTGAYVGSYWRAPHFCGHAGRPLARHGVGHGGSCVVGSAKPT